MELARGRLPALASSINFLVNNPLKNIVKIFFEKIKKYCGKFLTMFAEGITYGPCDMAQAPCRKAPPNGRRGPRGGAGSNACRQTLHRRALACKHHLRHAGMEPAPGFPLS
jgi:hypothetical protein